MDHNPSCSMKLKTGMHIQKAILLHCLGWELMSADNIVLPFEVKPLGIRGRVVRLGSVVDDILSTP